MIVNRDFTKSQREWRRERENDVMCALRMHLGHPQRSHVFAVMAPTSNHLFSRSLRTSKFAGASCSSGE